MFGNNNTLATRGCRGGFSKACFGLTNREFQSLYP
jgi:hypothetical protein